MIVFIAILKKDIEVPAIDYIEYNINIIGMFLFDIIIKQNYWDLMF